MNEPSTWLLLSWLLAGAAVSMAGATRETESRFSRFRSANKSFAVWYRISRSFSNDLLMIRSNSVDMSGLIFDKGSGSSFKIEYTAA